MRIGEIKPRVVETKHILTDLINPPTITQLSQSHQKWIEDRPALFHSRTLLGEIKSIMGEITEATEELWAEGVHPTRRRRYNCAEEIGDVAIYAISALNHLGVKREVLNTQVERTMQRIKWNQSQTPIAERLKHISPEHPIRHLQRMANFAGEIITNEHNPLDTEEFYNQLVESALLGVLESALEAGHHVTPRFEAVISAKLRKNERRFPEEFFTLRDGEDPEHRKAIGYAQVKIRERRWTSERAKEHVRMHTPFDPDLLPEFA